MANNFNKISIASSVTISPDETDVRYKLRKDRGVDMASFQINPNCHILCWVSSVLFFVCGVVLTTISWRSLPEQQSSYQATITRVLGPMSLSLSLILLISGTTICVFERVIRAKKSDYRCPSHCLPPKPSIVQALPLGIFVDSIEDFDPSGSISPQYRRNTFGTIPKDMVSHTWTMSATSRSKSLCVETPLPILLATDIFRDNFDSCDNCYHSISPLDKSNPEHYFDRLDVPNKESVACFPSTDLYPANTDIVDEELSALTGEDDEEEELRVLTREPEGKNVVISVLNPHVVLVEAVPDVNNQVEVNCHSCSQPQGTDNPATEHDNTDPGDWPNEGSIRKFGKVELEPLMTKYLQNPHESSI